MKIRNIEELESKLDESLAWRKKEMLSLRLLIDNDNSENKILIRAGIALLSAHFEGFVRDASNFYIVYVSSKNIMCQDLKNNILAIKIKDYFKETKETEKISVYGRLLEKIDNTKKKKYQLKYSEDKPIISTTNPSSSVLKEILSTIGIDSDIFSTKSNYIDYSLINNRNNIVHGQRVDLEVSDFNELFDIVIEMIEDYREVIVSAAENEDYIK